MSAAKTYSQRHVPACEAMQVRYGHAREVELWACGRRIESEDEYDAADVAADGDDSVSVLAGPLRVEMHARPDDWVVKMGDTWAVMPDELFRSVYVVDDES